MDSRLLDASQSPIDASQCPIDASQCPIDASQCPIDASQCPIDASQLLACVSAAQVQVLVRCQPELLKAPSPLQTAAKDPESMSLVRKLTIAYKHGHFSALIRLCGTSSPLEALAASSTDDLPLLVLSKCASWGAMASRIASAATAEFFEEGGGGRTAFAHAVAGDAPVSLLHLCVSRCPAVVRVYDKNSYFPLLLAAMHRSDTMVIRLLARSHPAGLPVALAGARAHNADNEAVVDLLAECDDAMDRGDFAAVMDLCGESDVLQAYARYSQKYPVHHAAMYESDLAKFQELIDEHYGELLREDLDKDTPLDCANRYNKNQGVVALLAEATRMCNEEDAAEGELYYDALA